jgi:hypothetical protein
MNQTTNRQFVLSEWANTGGGPLITMSSDLLKDWYGSFDAPTPREARFRFNNSNAPATDYDRACDVDDNLAEITVGEGTALVLGMNLSTHT